MDNFNYALVQYNYFCLSLTIFLQGPIGPSGPRGLQGSRGAPVSLVPPHSNLSSLTRSPV